MKPAKSPPARLRRWAKRPGRLTRVLPGAVRLEQAPLPPPEPVFAVGQGSHQGRRPYNEDRFGWFSQGRDELFVVADGMGGHNGGREAAETALAAFRDCFEALEEGPSVDAEGRKPDELLRRAVLEADRRVARLGEEEPALEGLGSTVVALWLRGREAWFTHVGDSRLYLFSQGRLQQLTRDHSLVQEMVEAGQLSPPEAEHHPDSHLLTQSLGGCLDPGRLRVGHRRCAEGDVFLLCTDGLSGPVPALDLTRVLGKSRPVQRQAKQLIELALAAGGPDNVTLQIISIGQWPVALDSGIWPRFWGRLSRHPGPFLIAGLICLALFLGFWRPGAEREPGRAEPVVAAEPLAPVETADPEPPQDEDQAR